MRVFSAHDAKQRFGSFLEAAERGPVEVRKYRRSVAVLLSAEEYRLLTKLKEQSNTKAPERSRLRAVSKLTQKFRNLLSL